MPVREGHRLGSCPFSSRSSDSMEVVDSPLNLAHQQCRKADRLLAAHKFEEAISCHGKAADLLTEAIKTTECDQARLSIELQRDSHIKQQQLIQERWKREIRREATKLGSAPPGCPAPLLPQPHRSLAASSAAPALGGAVEREYDTLLYQLQSRQSGPPPAPPPPGSKTTKDDKTRLEEQQTTIQDLRRLVDHLINENQRLAADNELLRSDNAALRSEQASELWVLPHANAIATVGPEEEGGRSNKKGKEIAIPQLPPLEMPAQEDLCLDDLPPLELPEDIRNELQELLDRDKA